SVSGATKWKSNTVKFIWDSFFIPGYWEWTEDILSRYGDILELSYRQIVQRPESKKCVSAQQWVDFWCKRSISYSALVKRKRYTDAPPKSTHNPNVEAHRVIHEGSGAKVGFHFIRVMSPFATMTLSSSSLTYLIGLVGNIGFCQDIPSAITRKWTTVTIKDLRHNIDKLCSAVESSSPNLKRVSLHDEGTGDDVRAAPPKRLHSTGALDEVEGENKSTSDAESEINFKH
ncbi:Porphyrin biosynthesis protein HemD, partial [Bienertia sinuspersici]